MTFAASESDLVQAYLTSNKITWSAGDWATCQPQGQSDQICIWNATKLGNQPIQSQLDAMKTYVSNQQQAAQYGGVLSAGLVITSTATSILNGTYAVDSAAQFNINSEAVSILTNGNFTNGQTTKPWPDASGALHTFNATQFKTFATAISQYIDALLVTKQTLLAGQSASWPSSSVTIP